MTGMHRRHGSACPPGRVRGFALVIVLWVLAGLTVVAVVVASSAQVSNANVKALRERVQAEAAFLSTSARIRVIAATGQPQQSTINGVKGALVVDGRVTGVGPGETVSMQDTRGLLNLNRPAEEQLAALLRRCGAADEAVAELIDALGDYTDRDGDKRLNGAEAFEYRREGLPEPRNAPLMTRDELWRVKGWQALRAAWTASGCDAYVTVHNDRRFNPNTAPEALLVSAGMTPDAARALVESRREGFEVLANQAGPGVVTAGGFGAAGGFAGQTLRVTHRQGGGDWGLVYELELTPTRDGGPWRLHESRIPRLTAAPGPALATLPAPDVELHDRQRAPTDASPTAPFSN